jgi:hypothetical protein
MDSLLYGDLEQSGRAEDIYRLKAELVQHQKRETSLQTELSEVKTQLIAVIEDKRILEKNISTIFNTATMEMTRKDREIDELRLQVLDLKEKNRYLRDTMEYTNTLSSRN